MDLQNLAETLVKVKDKANLKGDAIYEESFMRALIDLTPKTAKEDAPRWFSYFWGRTEPDPAQALKRNDLDIVPANPATSHTRSAKAQHNVLLEDAMHCLRQVRHPALQLRYPHDISPIPGIILFSFQHPSYFFHPSAFMTQTQYHRLGKMSLHLIEEQASLLEGLDEIAQLPAATQPQAKWQKYATLEADADTHLKEAVACARRLEQLLAQPLTADVITQMMDDAKDLLEELKNETAFRRASARLITHNAGFEVAYHRIMTEMKRCTLFTWLQDMRRRLEPIWQDGADPTALNVAYEKYHVLSFPKVYGYHGLLYRIKPDSTAHTSGPEDYTHIPNLVMVGPPQYVFDIDVKSGKAPEQVKAPPLVGPARLIGPTPPELSTTLHLLAEDEEDGSSVASAETASTEKSRPPGFLSRLVTAVSPFRKTQAQNQTPAQNLNEQLTDQQQEDEEPTPVNAQPDKLDTLLQNRRSLLHSQQSPVQTYQAPKAPKAPTLQLHFDPRVPAAVPAPPQNNNPTINTVHLQVPAAALPTTMQPSTSQAATGVPALRPPTTLPTTTTAVVGIPLPATGVAPPGTYYVPKVKQPGTKTEQ